MFMFVFTSITLCKAVYVWAFSRLACYSVAWLHVRGIQMGTIEFRNRNIVDMEYMLGVQELESQTTIGSDIPLEIC
jgi:hypothetical protein